MSENDSETKYCSNCKKDIAAANFTMHEVHCRRHLVLCEHCKEPVPRTEVEQHFNDVHAKIACTLCGVEVEKDQLDSHMEEECPKRKVSCEYCELEMPQDELAEHVGYCGTRTEACPRCGAYIMQKDQLRHNSSNCSYPPPTTSNADPGGVPVYRADGDRGAPFDESAFQSFGYGTDALSSSFDPFTFEEIRQALGPTMGGDSNERGMLVEDSEASAAAGERAVMVDLNKRSTRKGKVMVRKNDTRSRAVDERTATRGNGKSTTNKKSDLGHQRGAEQPIPPDMDYDTMLAMQLAAEEKESDPDEHLNQLISNFEKRSHRPVPRTASAGDDLVMHASPPDQNAFDAADEDMIPCEFCGEIFPAFALVHHQSVCDPLVSGIWSNGEDIPPAAGRNNEPSVPRRWSPVHSRPVIPVINNLGSASSAFEPVEKENYHLTDNGDYLLNSLENIMLPCEFCSELLPADFLVQHQAVCEVNSASTDRVTTPAAAQPSSGFPSAGPRNQFFPTSSTRARQRQADPTEELWTSIIGREAGEDQPAASRVGTKKQPNVHRVPVSNSSTRHVPVSVVRPDGQDSPHRSFQTGRSSRRPVNEGQDTMLQSRGSRSSGQGRSDNSQRTRHTLNRLLSDENETDQESTGSRKRVSNTTTGSTGVTSRAVMQAMQREQKTKSNRRPPRAQDQADEVVVDMSERRQRERGDHLFNGQDSSRTQPNQSRSRRSLNRQTPEWS